MKRILPSMWEEWPRLKSELRGKDLMLLCDFDGTLAPIALHPVLAQLPEQTRDALQRLSHKHHVIAGIVSGRALSEVRQMVGLKDVAYIGSHGYEISLPDGPLQTNVTTAEARRLRKLGVELQLLLKGQRGVWVERKPAGVAVHYRLASPRVVRRVTGLLQGVTRRTQNAFRTLQGKTVMEFLPRGNVNKGTAMRDLCRRLGAGRSSIRMYFGDDFTDESAFGALRRRDFGILVGLARPSAARHSLRSPADVSGFLYCLGGITR